MTMTALAGSLVAPQRSEWRPRGNNDARLLLGPSSLHNLLSFLLRMQLFPDTRICTTMEKHGGDRRAALVPQEALHQVPALERRWLSGGGEPTGSARVGSAGKGAALARWTRRDDTLSWKRGWPGKATHRSR